MKTVAVFLGTAAWLASLISSSLMAQTFTPPPTASKPVTELVHGVKLTDQYRWLEDGASPETIKWTRAQHDAALSWLDKNAPLPEGLHDELVRLTDRTVTSQPQFYKGREFFTRKLQGDAQAKLFTRLGGKELMLLDPVKLDPSGKSAISSFTFSRDAAICAVGVQTSGDELPTQYFIDTKSGITVHAPLPEVQSVSWTADNAVVYIEQRTKAQIAKQEPLFWQRLKLGSSVKDAPVVMRWVDAKNWGSVHDFEYAPYTLYDLGEGWQQNQLSLQKVGSDEPPKIIFNEKGARANIEIIGDTIYAQTSAGAPNGRLLKANVDKPEFKDWVTILPEQKEAVLEDFVVTKKHIVVREKRNLLEVLRVLDLNGKEVRALNAPELGSVTGLTYDRESNTLYAALATFNSPAKVYSINADTFEWALIYQDETVLDTTQIETKQVMLTSKNGAQVPMFVSFKKGTKLDGTNQTVLYGYGGFNIGIDVSYLGAFIPLINRGVVYAHVGLRGGNEFGEAWHEAGMLGNKQNVFDDFYASAEWLIKEGYTQPKRLVAMGGSNGGLLTGAAATQRPELFAGIISQVPLLDMVRYHKFRIARFWIPEYGDPDQAKDFAWLLRYSPYHNIRAGVSLPTTLVVAGENDTRVDPLHAKKFVALAQNNPGQTNPVLLKMEYGAGHGSGKPTAQIVEDREAWQRFIFAVTK